MCVECGVYLLIWCRSLIFIFHIDSVEKQHCPIFSLTQRNQLELIITAQHKASGGFKDLVATYI